MLHGRWYFKVCSLPLFSDHNMKPVILTLIGLFFAQLAIAGKI
ncbi:hypothetical protein [Synechocystis sp. FACHB-383]|nr:hypothetical protein [Synechocystis sp. FACHB-383]